MRQDIAGDTFVALKSARNSGVLANPAAGVSPLGYIAGLGAKYPPHWAAINTSGINTAAGTLYYIPYYFWEVRAFTGLKTYNTGTGDNTEVFRMGVYQASPSTHLPSTLIADCGEVTLSGAAAERTLASAFTPAYVGWHYLAYHANTVAAMEGISNGDTNGTAVGVMTMSPIRHIFGIDSLTTLPWRGTFGGYSVSTTYGALASTAVAPTGIETTAPLVTPYIT